LFSSPEDNFKLAEVVESLESAFDWAFFRITSLCLTWLDLASIYSKLPNATLYNSLSLLILTLWRKSTFFIALVSATALCMPEVTIARAHESVPT
jgi:hypothetical protein